MMSRISALIVAALSALAGCSGDPANGTEGQLGTLRFEYATAGVCSGCEIDREVLVGSVLDIDVHGLNVKTKYLVRSTSQLIEGARFEIIEGAGHIPCVEKPAETARLIGDFLNEAGWR